MTFADLWGWINERHAIYLRKAAVEGATVPEWADPAGYDAAGPWRHGHYTDDEVLREWRFCCVFRELDRVTRYIRSNIREPNADHPNLWLMLAAARWVNWPPTLREIMAVPGAWPSHPDFAPSKLATALRARRDRGDKVYTGAYKIPAPNGRWRGMSKEDYVADVVLGSLWAERDQWQRAIATASTLEEAWDRLRRSAGFGPFMAYQVVLEWRHTRYLRDATDVMTWAAVGPGSSRGLNRVHNREVDARLSQAQAVEEMRSLLQESRSRLAPWVPDLEMEDVQNALCEFDKYERVRRGEGKLRARYTPRGGDEGQGVLPGLLSAVGGGGAA